MSSPSYDVKSLYQSFPKMVCHSLIKYNYLLNSGIFYSIMNRRSKFVLLLYNFPLANIILFQETFPLHVLSWEIRSHKFSNLMYFCLQFMRLNTLFSASIFTIFEQLTIVTLYVLNTNARWRVSTFG